MENYFHEILLWNQKKQKFLCLFSSTWILINRLENHRTRTIFATFHNRWENMVLSQHIREPNTIPNGVFLWANQSQKRWAFQPTISWQFYGLHEVNSASISFKKEEKLLANVMSTYRTSSKTTWTIVFG